ncbi:biorientation of chromosomes in cell division protein 1-like 1 isoform X3 [Varanus komodoensis]|nr:biorientation of chromosomes in cell division protein 1-like 1 isoform X3 [Varanus komodoensis]XP_044273569.1 biorientation of chromosomes in cell division protein 1-like 1 isoform X3 [Varanus komodoensis]
MLESGIDRIISQVVDPKINHIFRPQVEKAVHEFLATLNHKEEPSPSTAPPEEKSDAAFLIQGVSATTPSANVANDAMSILETITSLNQEASAARASTEVANSKTNDRVSKKFLSHQSMDGSIERDRNVEDILDGEKPPCNSTEESFEPVANCEDVNNLFSSNEEGKTVSKDINSLVNSSKDILQEGDEQKNKLMDKCDRKPENLEKGERRKEKKEKSDRKVDLLKKSGDDLKPREEKTVRDKEIELIKYSAVEKNSSKHKANESTKEALEDSDVDILSDITVSSVHTSDLSSFEEESEEELALSDSTEEGEIVSDVDEEEHNQIKTKPEASAANDKKTKPGRQAYVHKPYLYSKYYSDSDDERTVEQRRQSVAREKEERLLRRRLNREKLEEKRKQKAAEKTKTLKTGNQGKSIQNPEESSGKGLELKASGASIKDVLKEQRFLEKKVALSRKRKRESRHDEEGREKKHEQADEDLGEIQRISESGEKSSIKDVKANQSKNEGNKPVRRLPESVHSTDENRSDSKGEKEHKRKTSLSLLIDGIQQDTESRDLKPWFDRTEACLEESQKQKSVLKNEKHLKKDDSETQTSRNVQASKREARSSKDKNEKDRSLSEDKSLLKHKAAVHKGDGVHKAGDEVENLPSERGLKSEESVQKHNQLAKALSDDKAERKTKHRSERKLSLNNKDVKNVAEYASKNEDNSRKENRKDRQVSIDKVKTEHKSKRLSGDARPQKDSQSALKQHSSVIARRSESYSEDKHDAESTNLDNTLRQGDSTHKDKRRSKSVLEERSFLKSKSKSHNKQAKVPESELQESSTKQEPGQKLDKDKYTEESDPDKQYKSKNEIKVFEENSVELELAGGVHSVSSSQKDASHRVKLQSGEKSSMKERSRSDKDLGSSRLERKLPTEGHRSRNLKHSSKDIKKREEDNKPEDKGAKQLESHAKIQENNVPTDKKPIKRLTSENRKGSSSTQEVAIGEEKVTPVSWLFPAPQKTVWTSEHSLHSEQSQQPMEIELEQRHSNTHHQVSQGEEGSSNNAQEPKLKNTSKDQVHQSLTHELNKTLHIKEVSKSVLSSCSNPKQKDESFLTEEMDAPNDAFKQLLKDVGPIEQEQYHAITENEASDETLYDASKENEKLKHRRVAENAQTPENLKNVTGPPEASCSPENKASREDAAHQETMDTELVEGPLSCVSKEESFNLDTPCSEDTISDNQAYTVEVQQHDTTTLSSNIKEGNTANMKIITADGQVPLSPEQAGTENMSALTGIQEATAQERIGLIGVIKNDGLTGLPVAFMDVTAGKSAPTNFKENLPPPISTEISGEGSFVKKNKGATECKGKTKDNENTSVIIKLSSGSLAKDVLEGISRVSVVASEAEGVNVKGVVEDKIESSVVGSSVGGSSIHNSLEIDPVVIGTSTEGTSGSTVAATSTEEGIHEGTSNLQKEGDATITCSEEKSKTTLRCTSIEADEGFSAGSWAENNRSAHSVIEKCFGECTVTVTEGSGGVTEGLAVCESSSTTTKEEESGECVVNYVEESAKLLVNGSRVQLDQSVSSFETEEKDDAVTSAGSEERCMASACGDTSNFGSASTGISETESDGAVTSAGTEAQDGFMISETPHEFQSNAAGIEQVKAVEGAVTCTGAEIGRIGSALCSVTGTDSQEESAVTGVSAEMANNIAAKPHTDKGEDIVNGESAVTSTGITTEDDPETAASCTGLDSNGSFVAALDTEEKYEHATDSTEARAETNAIEVSQGSYDDEGCVTSTGAKEDDEEGENFVTSTGRGNEEAEHVLACTGTEESERVLVCVGATESQSSSDCLVAGHLGTELGKRISNADKATVDSRTALEKEIKSDDIHNIAKGVVESSTTSVGVGCENMMALLATKEEETLFTQKYECDMISATSNNESIGQVSEEERNESTTSSLDNRKCEGLFRIVSKKAATPSASASEDDKGEGERISTSAVNMSPTSPTHRSAKHTEQTLPHVARTVKNVNKTSSLTGTDFSAPMPSTAIDHMNQEEAAVKPNKVSTSILEEFEAPMPSVATEDGDSLLATKGAVEMAPSVEMYAVPMPSVCTGRSVEKHTVHGKEERDECTVISTSITEEAEAVISQEDTEGIAQHLSLRSEQTTNVAMISTSSIENFETSVFPTEDQENNQVFRTEGKIETFTISTTESSNRATHDVVVQMETRERDEDTMISTELTEECKAFQDAVSQESELVVQSTEKSNQTLITLVEKEVKSDAHELSVGNTKPDQPLVTLSTQNMIARRVEECDSASFVATSKDVPFEFASIENERKIVPCAKEFEYTTLLPSENNDSSSTVLHKEGERFYKGEHEDTLKESTTLKTTSDTKSTEMPMKTDIKTLKTEGEKLCTEICLDFSADKASTEVCMHGNGTQEDGQHTEVPSSPSGGPLERERGNATLTRDDINNKPTLKSGVAEERNLPNSECSPLLLSDLGKFSEERTFARGTDLCRQYSSAEINTDQEPEAFYQGSTAYSNDKEILPVVAEELEQKMKVTADEDLQSPAKENLFEDSQPEEISKAPEISGTSALVEAVDDQVPDEKALEVEIPYQKKENDKLETERHPDNEEHKSDVGLVCQILEEETERSHYFEATTEINAEATAGDTKEMPDDGPKSEKPSSKAVEEKDENVGKVDICEKPGLASSLNPVEVNQQVIVKRKRGRPRKYPVAIMTPQAQASEADTSTGNVLQSSGPSSRQKITPKVKGSLNERRSEAEGGKTEVVLRRRGRKPKRPLIPSEETGMDSVEPERKRQKLAPAVEGETKEQDDRKEGGDNREEDGGNGDADEMHSGATTRSASRLEAQRKQPSKPTTRAASKNQTQGPTPPTNRRKLAGKKRSAANAKSNKSPLLAQSKLQPSKRKREVSPSATHKKGHQRAEETEVKRSKR